MRFRWKIQLLLLAISLPPMILVASFYHAGTTGLGNELAASSQDVLVGDAYRLLHRIVNDYGRILSRNQQTLELAIAMQALEVERRLANPTPPGAPIYVTGASVASASFQQGLVDSDQHFRISEDGSAVPLKVNFANQVFHLAPDADQERAEAEMRRLADMTEAYGLLQRKIPNQVMWQYTGLESGVISNYPGVASFPRDFDPRERPWYRTAEAAGEPVWGEPYVDVLSGDILLTLSQPVHHGDGSFAGVTSIDIPFGSVLGVVQLPADWAKQGRVLSVVRDAEAPKDEPRLKIIAQKSYQALRQPWQSPVEISFLRSNDPQELAAMAAAATAGNSGVRRMGYNQVDSFWAFGAAGPGGTFPVVIIPYDFIVAKATAAKARVIETTLNALHLTAVLLLVVAAIVTALAFFGSRFISRPVRQLAEAAIDLANGDYQARVDIKTGGELKMLGEAFNAMGPRLKERQRMQASLALAKEVQQYLLPAATPELHWIEIAADCSFSEELGGDYYDFIDLREFGPGRLGVAVGDVSGHGVGAALLMASVRGGLHSLVKEHHAEMGEMFRLLNKIFLAGSGMDQFMTLFFGVIDESERSFRWISAGHGPCYWMQGKSGDIRELETTGMPLGIMDDAEYHATGPVSLASGDVLILGTDGLWETQNAAGEMFGTERLLAQLAHCREQSSADIHRAILAARREFCAGAPQKDDMTLVVIKMSAGDGHGIVDT